MGIEDMGEIFRVLYPECSMYERCGDRKYEVARPGEADSNGVVYIEIYVFSHQLLESDKDEFIRQVIAFCEEGTVGIDRYLATKNARGTPLWKAVYGN